MHRTAEKWAEGVSRREFLVGALGVGFTAGGGGSLVNERNRIEITRHVLNSEASLSGGRVSFHRGRFIGDVVHLFNLSIFSRSFPSRSGLMPRARSNSNPRVMFPCKKAGLGDRSSKDTEKAGIWREEHSRS